MSDSDRINTDQTDFETSQHKETSQVIMEHSGRRSADQTNQNIPKVEELSPFQDCMKNILKTEFRKLGKIKTASELVDLIERTYQYNEGSKRKIFDQITSKEILDFIFASNNEFLLTVAAKLSYKCLAFLKSTDLGFLGISSRLHYNSTITKTFVEKLATAKLKSNVKEEILLMLLHFNENGVARAIRNFDNEEMKRMLEFTQRNAERNNDSDESGKFIFSLRINFKILSFLKNHSL